MFAQTTDNIFRFGRIQENADWFWPLVVTALLLWYVVHRYRRDAADLKRGMRIFLCMLRMLVVVGLLIVYLHPQWERRVGSSRVVLLVDTSASMSNRDILAGSDQSPANGAETTQTPSAPNRGPSRLEAITDWIDRTDLIERLREKHDVVVYRFDRNTVRLLSESQNRIGDGFTTSSLHDGAEKPDENPNEEPNDGDSSTEISGDSLATLSAEGDQTRLGEALFEVIQRERGEPISGIVLLSDGGQNAGTEIDAALENAERTLIPIHTVGIGALHRPLNFRALAIDTAERAFPNDPFTVRAQVELVGGETATSRSEPARTWKLPVGLYRKSVPGAGETGATNPDSGGQNNRTENNAERATASSAGGSEVKIGEKTVEISSGGVLSIDFDVRVEQTGTQQLILRIAAPTEDTDASDDVVETEIEIVDRKDRVLLYAGGPGRDYQFLLSQIFRDKSMQVDVYLPWAQKGISQSADAILDFFPATLPEIAKYDCVVAFDPNWSELSPEEINTLEHWVARQGGGLVVVAGPVFSADPLTGWTNDPHLAKIKALYPIEFAARGALEHGYFSQPTPMRLHFSRAGEDAEFLRPVDDATEARAIWTEFPGFYGFLNVKGIKPTATLLASLDASTWAASASGVQNNAANPRSAFFVEQFYGAGHVLYIGGAEIWRLRRFDPVYFEKMYTKIIRHVSQGRLQRQSDRGTLTSDKRRYALGAIAAIRATVTDEHLQPLAIPAIPVEAVSPSGKRKTLRFTLDPNVPGAYQAHLPLTEEGDWTLTLQPPGMQERLARTIRVRMSDLERENISRNETILKTIAEKSGGRYFSSPGLAQAPLRESPLYGTVFMHEREIDDNKNVQKSESVQLANTTVPPELLDLLKVRSQRAVADVGAEQRTATVLLSILAGLLLLEWLVRRLAQLA